MKHPNKKAPVGRHGAKRNASTHGDGRHRYCRKKGPDLEAIKQAIDPAAFFERELGVLNGCGPWRRARCCFHRPDRRPSLSVNVTSGAFRCFACGASGGDVIAFAMRLYEQTLPETIDRLGREWGVAR